MYQKVHRKGGSLRMRIFPELENWSLFWGFGEYTQLRKRENIATVKQGAQEHEVGAVMTFVCSYCLG